MSSLALAHPARGTLARAATAQLFGLAVALWLASIARPHDVAWMPWLLVALQAICAGGVARALGMASWWVALHLAFGPALLAALLLGVPPGLSGAAFLLLLAVFGVRTLTDQVPLFLSSRRALHALARYLPERGFSLIDLGAGTGRALRAIRRQRPDARLEGVESAPFPWVLARLGGLRGRYRARFGDMWDCHLSAHDVVYAYLSPAAMPRLWQKARAEMRPGSLLVSNSFTVPGQAPDEFIRYGREAGAVLYLWRMR
jgi:hypothetical protein